MAEKRQGSRHLLYAHRSPDTRPAPRKRVTGHQQLITGFENAQCVSEAFIQAMSAGVSYGSQVTRPCRVFRESDHTFTIILTQGLKRQIRRMCRALGYRVTDLNRVRLMNLTLEGLEEGESRQLTACELSQLLRLVGH